MPGFDGKGPKGRGAMSGLGRGYCLKPVTKEEKNMLTKRAKGAFPTGKLRNQKKTPGTG
ncbi:MAG: DUF5320 domain-containing protein [Bacillota bacterium]|nr:DUF5320 domain-containing protein [Bacillota bacterium]MDW7683547.1 DUF5320 domain-containing protein [Bacillota bacterium]